MQKIINLHLTDASSLLFIFNSLAASTSFDYRLYFTPILILPAGLIVIIATIIFGIKVYIKYRSTLEALHHCQLKVWNCTLTIQLYTICLCIIKFLCVILVLDWHAY